jgi:oxygen-dependent protoporphyrinogen oxidase
MTDMTDADLAASPSTLDVIVVGAGISGLTAAFRLHKAGRRITVVDAGARPGGVIGTVRRDGALYECGPNSTLDTTPLINAMLDDLGIRGERLDADEVASTRYVVRDGTATALPTSPAAFFTTPAFSLGAKLMLLREPFVRRAPADLEESIAQFVRRRLGQEFLDYAIDPFVAGIYAGDPERISVPAAFPRLHALEQKYGSLIKGQILGARERRKNPEQSKNAAKSFSFKAGMQTLTDALARAIGGVTSDARVTRVAPGDDGQWTVDGTRAGEPFTLRARAVVLATPAPTAAALIAPFASAAARGLAAIDYAPVAIVATAYRRADVAHSLAGFGFLVPRKERRRVLGTLFSSSMFAGRAPEGTVLLTTFAGGRRNPDVAALTDEAVVEVVTREHRELLGASAAPQWSAVTRWPQAIPQYDLGHLDRVLPAAEAETEWPGLAFCANWRGGVSVSDCVKNGHATAERLHALLG